MAAAAAAEYGCGFNGIVGVEASAATATAAAAVTSGASVGVLLLDALPVVYWLRNASAGNS